MSPTQLVGNIVFGLVKLSINDLAQVDRLVWALERDKDGAFAKKIDGILPPDQPTEPPPQSLPEEETDPAKRAQLEQMVEMFEVITQVIPNDYQMLEILKEAYFELGRRDEGLATWKKLIVALQALGQQQSAKIETERLLIHFPEDPGAHRILAEIR